MTAEWFAGHQERAETRQRYHCLGCGRFVPTATVEAGFSSYDPYEWEANGTCKQCGPVEVHWGAL